METNPYEPPKATADPAEKPFSLRGIAAWSVGIFVLLLLLYLLGFALFNLVFDPVVLTNSDKLPKMPQRRQIPAPQISCRGKIFVPQLPFAIEVSFACISGEQTPSDKPSPKSNTLLASAA